MRIKQHYTTDGIGAISKKDLRDIQRETWSDIGLEWHDEYKMIHFSRAGTHRYKFVPRSGDHGSGRAYKGSYTERKVLRRRNGQGVRSIGENQPNVWSGDSRERARASRKADAKASSSTRGHVDIIINAPRLNLKNPHSQVHPAKEVTATVPFEISRLQDHGNDQFAKRVGDFRGSKKLS